MLRRSLLSVPGDKEAMIAKAQSLAVDSLFLDLEDSVAPQAKDAARTILDDAATGGVVWSKQPATAPNFTTSSPAVDPGRQVVYSYGLDGKAHKYQVGDGIEVTTGGWPQLATTKPSVEKGSSALAFASARSGATVSCSTRLETRTA